MQPWGENNQNTIYTRFIVENEIFESKHSQNRIKVVHFSLYRASLQNCIILKWTSNIWNILGPAYDLTICEVRNTSLVLLWKAPVYEGKSPITGYLVDYKEVDTEDWITANDKPTSKRYFKVTFSSVSVNSKLSSKNIWLSTTKLCIWTWASANIFI